MGLNACNEDSISYIIIVIISKDGSYIVKGKTFFFFETVFLTKNVFVNKTGFMFFREKCFQ